jgi:uncharacterized protein (DUF362 family)
MARALVCARRCAADAADARVRETLFEMLDSLDGLAASLGPMRRIAVKSNLGILDVRLHKGRPVALTDATVVEATVAWLRAHSDANILVGDASTGVRCEEVAAAIGLTDRLAPHGARIADFNDEPYATFRIRDGLMFREYTLTEEMARADMVVSIAKMKSHLATGVTLTLKNLFGIPPTPIYGAPRRYFHAPIRLPRVIADLGLILRPSLCVIDGLVAQTQKEWHGPPLEAGWLVAGDNVVATDIVAMQLMGIAPAADYPDPPFHFDRNPVKLAAERGLGPLALDDIALVGDPLAPVSGFYSDRHMEASLLDEIRRSVAEQAALFERRRGHFVRDFGGRYIGLYDGEVVYAGENLDNLKSRGQIARERGRSNHGLYLKKVVPSELEVEQFGVYESLLNGARA